MLTIITGPMFSGKTAELIRRVNRLKIAGKTVQLFKFRGDARYASMHEMASFDGAATPAIPTATAADILANLDMSADVFVIDEVQFYDDTIIDLVMTLTSLGKEVIGAGLNLDFRGEPFTFAGSTKTIAELIARADTLIKLSAICTHSDNSARCGRDATRTQRLIEGKPAEFTSPIVQIGSSEQYEARCHMHHLVPGRQVTSVASCATLSTYANSHGRAFGRG